MYKSLGRRQRCPHIRRFFTSHASTFGVLLVVLLCFLALSVLQSKYVNSNYTQPAFHKPSIKSIAPVASSQKYNSELLLIDTEVCQLKDYPIWDAEINRIYASHFNQRLRCKLEYSTLPVHIKRVNLTKLVIDELKDDSDWKCNASQIIRTGESDASIDTKKPLAMGHITDFSQNKWNSVSVQCRNNKTNTDYDEIMMLVQDHINRQFKNLSSDKRPKYNVILLGLDSISRLNSQRHLRLLNDFYRRNGFVELTGYHKVGENTFPNVIPLLTGKPDWKVYNDTWKNFKWDNVPTLFKEFREAGYTTTFIEDMPPYGLWRRRGGYRKQPTDYYIYEAQRYVWNGLTDYYACYKAEVESVKYWNYFLDQLRHYQSEKDMRHFSYVHSSTLTHDWFNYAGYADLPLSELLESIFTSGYQKDTVIISFSDHAIRFGNSVDTDANVHESKLPYVHIYIPDSLKLDGKNAIELRDILFQNRKKLTSHYDLHATLKHLLNGTPPTDEEFGISLFTPIPGKRLCSDAGVLPQYCMCNSYEKLALTKEVQEQAAQFALDHINNNLLKDFKKLCVDLTLTAVKRVFESVDKHSSKRRWLIVFTTAPNSGLFESIIDLDDQSSNSTTPSFKSVINTSRLSRYGSQADCLGDELKAEPFCYCKDLLNKKS